MLVFAGPGTGKTETLARRFASLVAGDKVDPSRIVVLTFSRRAADEMRERILLRLRQRLNRELAVTELFIDTFHAFCSRLLDADAPRIRHEDLLTPVRERLLFERIIVDEAPPLLYFSAARDSQRFAVDALNFIAQLKGQGVSADRLVALAADDRALRDLALVYRALERARAEKGLRDFRDLVIDAVDALGRPDSAARAWLARRRFRHVLVDEFQDSDGVQLRLLQAMADVAVDDAVEAPEFCFVGDVNQSIYRFRGAMPDNVERARRDFQCVELKLATNRRSAQAVLDVANRAPRLQPGSLTEAEDASRPGSVALRLCETCEDEIDAVCDCIAGELAAGTPAREIAVLLRQAEPYQLAISQGLARRGIMVAPNAETGFAQDVLIDAVATALRLLEGEQPKRLWLRLLANPLLGYSARAINMAFDEARRRHIEDPAAALRPAFGDFVAAWRRCKDARRGGDLVGLVRTIVRELRLLDAAAAAQPPMGYDPLASPARLAELLTAARDFAESPRREERDRTARFVERLDEILGLLTSSYQPPAANEDGVRVMTIHAAKGLEFTFVAIPQLLDGVLPAALRSYPLLSRRSLARLRDAGVRLFADPDGALLEESSLWYVALTRAKTTVLATAPRRDAEDVELQLSPFAGSIDTRSDTFAADPSFGSPVRSLIPENLARPIPPAERRMTIVSIDRLSPSAIQRYVSCPRRFFYQDIVRLPEDGDKDAASYGTALHAALRRFHDQVRDFSTPFDDAIKTRHKRGLRELLHEELAALACSLGIPPDSGLMRYEQAMLGRQLDRYVECLALEAAAHPFAVLECEKDVEYAVNGLRIAGTVDRVDRQAGGGLAIRDYKSGKFKRAGAAELAKALAQIDAGTRLYGNASRNLAIQTLLYVPGVEAAFGEPVKRADYIYLRGKETPRHGEDGTSTCVDSIAIAEDDAERVRLGADTFVTPADVRRVTEEIAAGIAAECLSGELTAFDTALDPETCRFCSYTRVCSGAGTIAFRG